MSEIYRNCCYLPIQSHTDFIKHVETEDNAWAIFTLSFTQLYDCYLQSFSTAVFRCLTEVFLIVAL